MEKKNNDDKPKIAVALEYTPGEQAPKILATGRGYIAESIIEKAGEADRTRQGRPRQILSRQCRAHLQNDLPAGKPRRPLCPDL